jgi:hypothetical protein
VLLVHQPEVSREVEEFRIERVGEIVTEIGPVVSQCRKWKVRVVLDGRLVQEGPFDPVDEVSHCLCEFLTRGQLIVLSRRLVRDYARRR